MSNLTQHQQEVYEAIIKEIKENLFSFEKSEDIEDRMLSLTGAAGTGKSYLTAKIAKEISKSLEENTYFYNEDLYVTAPTHKAVKVINDMLRNHGVKAESCTIQSFLNMKPVYDYETGAERFIINRFSQNRLSASFLIVDESSMVSKELYEFIIESIKQGYVNTVLFIGDPFQLLPVNQSSSEVFRLGKQYKLTQVVRQAKDSNIIQLATKIRKSIANKKYSDLKKLFEENKESEDIQFFNNKEQFIEDFYKNSDWHREDKILTTYANTDVNYFNNLIRRQFWKERGNSNPKYFLPKDMVRFKKPLNISKSFSITSQVMFQNSEEVMIDNAELINKEKLQLKFWKCTVVGKEEHEFFRVIDSDSLVKFNEVLNRYINKAKSEKHPYNIEWWKKYFQLRDAFADVQYVFAATTHKLQGSTYDTVYFDLNALLNSKHISDDLLYRLVYVAVTRARKSIKVLF